MIRTKRFVATLLFLLLVLPAAAAIARAGLPGLPVQEFSLPNGMLFLVVERQAVPQVACRLAIRAGSALEQRGKTGIAHMLEHMLFKGTKNFGSTDPELDAALQTRIEAAYQAIRREECKRRPDEALIRLKKEEMARLQAEAQSLYVPQVFSAQLGRNGAVGVNAFTTADQTQYVASVPSDMLEQWFSIVSEQIFEPAMRGFYIEKEVVQREWAYRYQNNAGGAAWLDLFATAFRAHPYGNPTIGWQTDMERFSATDAEAFHSRYYNPTNAVCVLVGAVSLDKVRELAERYFARYPPGERAPEEVTQEPSQAGPRRSIRYLPGARGPQVRIGFHGAPMGTQAFYALDVLSMVLSAGESGRLTQRLVNSGKTVSAWAAHPDQRFGGFFVVGGSPHTARNAQPQEAPSAAAALKSCEELEALLLAELEELRQTAVTERELKRIKRLNRRQFLERLRSNEDLADTLANLEVQTGWRYLNDYLERMKAVTADEIRKVANEYLAPEKRTTVFVLPGGEPAHPPKPYSESRALSGAKAMAVVTAASKSLANRSKYPTPEGWRHPLSFQRRPEKIIYPLPQESSVLGAPLFYLPDRELPFVELTILINAGELDVPESLSGLGSLLGRGLLRGGTLQRDPREVAELLDEKALRLSFSVGLEDSLIHLSALREDWEAGIALLRELLTQPGFDEEALEALRRQLVTDLQRQNENAQAVVMREAMKWHFKGHPYGRDPLLALKTVPRITRQDLEDFLRRNFVPSKMVLAVSGDLERQEAERALRGLLEALPPGEKQRRTILPPQANEPVLCLVHKPGQVQAQVGILLPGPLREDRDFWPLRLLVDMLGGDDSLLSRRLRDDLGLVYSAGFFQSYRRRAGFLIGVMGCRSDQTRRALAETLQLMSSLRLQIPREEFALKRLDALNSFVFNVDTPAALVEVVGRYALRREPLNTLELIQDAYLKATPADLAPLAQRYLDPKKVQIFVVADRRMQVAGGSGRLSLEQDLEALAREMGLPFRVWDLP